jgi:hypothetical protein
MIIHVSTPWKLETSSVNSKLKPHGGRKRRRPVCSIEQKVKASAPCHALQGLQILKRRRDDNMCCDWSVESPGEAIPR